MKGINIGYIRVSSIFQNPERQLENITLDKIFFDKVSGKDINRPELNNLLDFVREGDTIYIHSLDRLARNLADLKNIINLLTNKGVKIIFVKENLTFSGEDSPISNLILNLLGSFAEFERALIRERQREGIEIAKKKGLYKGRKKRLNDEQIEKIKFLVSKNIPKSHIAKDFGISRETLYKYLK